MASDLQMKQVAKDANLTQEPPTILCVDDEAFNLDIMEKHLAKAGYNTIMAEDGDSAWLILNENNNIDVVLLDRMMPGMDGLEVLKLMKNDAKLRNIPVIMQTAAGGDNAIKEGIDQGAYYYVTKPYQADVLLSIVSSAIKERSEAQFLRHEVETIEDVQKFLQTANFNIRTLNDVRQLAVYLSEFSIDPMRTVFAITSLLSNAVEHGNLGFGQEEKYRLLLSNEWDQAIKDRQNQPEHSDKKVSVTLSKIANSQNYIINIKDEGEGFKWQNYMDFDPNRMTDPNGRGIAMANANSPKCITYIGNGSEVEYLIQNEVDEE